MEGVSAHHFLMIFAADGRSIDTTISAGRDFTGSAVIFSASLFSWYWSALFSGTPLTNTLMTSADITMTAPMRNM